jgi:hypothetical protein
MLVQGGDEGEAPWVGPFPTKDAAWSAQVEADKPRMEDIGEAHAMREDAAIAAHDAQQQRNYDENQKALGNLDTKHVATIDGQHDDARDMAMAQLDRSDQTMAEAAPGLMRSDEAVPPSAERGELHQANIAAVPRGLGVDMSAIPQNVMAEFSKVSSAAGGSSPAAVQDNSAGPKASQSDSAREYWQQQATAGVARSQRVEVPSVTRGRGL